MKKWSDSYSKTAVMYTLIMNAYNKYSYNIHPTILCIKPKKHTKLLNKI